MPPAAEEGAVDSGPAGVPETVISSPAARASCRALMTRWRRRAESARRLSTMGSVVVSGRFMRAPRPHVRQGLPYPRYPLDALAGLAHHGDRFLDLGAVLGCEPVEVVFDPADQAADPADLLLGRQGLLFGPVVAAIARILSRLRSRSPR